MAYLANAGAVSRSAGGLSSVGLTAAWTRWLCGTKGVAAAMIKRGGSEMSCVEAAARAEHRAWPRAVLLAPPPRQVQGPALRRPHEEAQHAVLQCLQRLALQGGGAAARRQHLLPLPPPALRRQDAPRQAVPRDKLGRARARLPAAMRRIVLRAPHAAARAPAVPERACSSLRTPLRPACTRYDVRDASRAQGQHEHRWRRPRPAACATEGHPRRLSRHNDACVCV